MLRKTIISWLQKIDSEPKSFESPNLLAPKALTLPPPDSNCDQQRGPTRKRKRISTSIIDMNENINENEETPRKKPRKRKANDEATIHSSHTSNSSLTSLTALTLLSQPSQSQSQSQSQSPSPRPGSPSKDILIELRSACPAIDWRPEGRELPPMANELRRTLIMGTGHRVIPSRLKAKMQHLDPSGTEVIPEYAFDDSSLATEHELDELWDLVCKVWREARRCHEYGQDENAWCLKVVEPLMQFVLKSSQEQNIGLERIQTQSIDVTFLPGLSFLPVDKKADYAWAFTPLNKEVEVMYDHLSFQKKQLSLSQMRDSYTEKLAIFAGAKVNRDTDDSREALTQLAIWLSSGLANLKSLRLGEPKEDEHLLPTLGWTIQGHQWSTYIACTGNKKEDDVQIFGPFAMLRAGTEDYLEIFKLIDLLKRAEKYGRTTYWTWLKGTILDPLR